MLPTNRKCSVEGCLKKHHAKGFCKHHYRHSYDKPVETKIEPQNRTCSVKGCSKKHHARGYCRYHYDHTPVLPVIGDTKRCSYDGCSEKHHAKGLCKRHYRRLYENKPKPENIAKPLVPLDEIHRKTEEFVKKVTDRIFGNNLISKDRKKIETLDPIFTETEEKLTIGQKEDLRAHYEAMKRLEDLKDQPLSERYWFA